MNRILIINPSNFWGSLQGGVFGVVLGECLTNTHPSTFPLYKGLSDILGGVLAIF